MSKNTTIPSDFLIRPIHVTDDAVMEKLIRTVLIEFGADRPGFAWQDSELSRLTSAYAAENKQYWVAKRNDRIIGGCGIGTLQPTSIPNVCELQKMYILPEFRQFGVGRLLMDMALGFAREQHYRWCYLETLSTMSQAERLYKRTGFMELPRPMVQTEHGSCDRWFILDMLHVD